MVIEKLFKNVGQKYLLAKKLFVEKIVKNNSWSKNYLSKKKLVKIDGQKKSGKNTFGQKKLGKKIWVRKFVCLNKILRKI